MIDIAHFLSIDTADLLDKYWRFVIVGGFGFFVDVSITWILKEKILVQKYFANSFGFVCGVTFNYVFNRIWTFKSNNPDIFWQYGAFLTIGLIGLVIVNGVIYLLHDRFKWNFYLSKILAMIVFMFWNFSANYFYTFQN